MERLQHLRAQFPQYFEALAQDPVHEEPVLEYITELEVRQDIFREYREIARTQKITSKLNGIALGIILVAPVDSLRAGLEWIRKTDRQSIAGRGTIDALGSQMALDGIRAFVAKGGRPASVPTTPQRVSSNSPSLKRQRVHSPSSSDHRVPAFLPSSPGKPSPKPPSRPPSASPRPPGSRPSPGTPRTTRKAQAVALAKARDNWECVLSGTKDPEAAHVFPSSTTGRGNFLSLGELLKVFWGRERAQEWFALFQDTGVTESAQNLVCLNRQLHWWFDSAKFALKPLRKIEDRGIVVQFHWLKASGLKPYTSLGKDLPFSDILSRAGLSDNDAWGDKLAYRKSGLPLQTGQTFVLGAMDPKQAPSFELLHLSWDLLRVAAISGAAEPLELDEDEDDSRVGYLGWEENEDEEWLLPAEGVEFGEEAEEPEDLGRSKRRR